MPMTTDKLCPTCGATYGEDHVFCPRDRTALRSTAPGDDLIGSVVGERYLILERIGGGGMGEVYKAQDVRLQRPAAIKVLRAQLTLDAEALARFSRECANGSKISSRHVAQILDYGETDQGRPFLAMELVPGESLKALLDREGALEPPRAIQLIRQIAAGLDAAHRLEVVHRDLKPENVLICLDEGGSEQAKVVDFGISKAVRDESQQVTSTGFVTGTREYMSPEQIMGEALDCRSDVYALGLLSYLMLTGRLPFAGATPEHAMLMRLQHPPLPLHDAQPDIAWDPGLQPIFSTALARQPGDRYAAAGEFARALAEAVERADGAARRFHAIEPAADTAVNPARQVVRRRGWLPAAAVLGLCAAGTIGYLAIQRPTQSGAAAEPIDVGLDTAPGTDSGLLTDPPTQAYLAPPSETTFAPPPDTVGPIPAPSRVEESLPAAKPRPKPTRPADASAELGKYKDLLIEPGLSGDSVRRIIASLDILLGRLRTRGDSVQAQLYRAEAFALAGEDERACAILEAARPRADARQREKIALWEARKLCTFSEWTPS
jgi:Protein kinase domain